MTGSPGGATSPGERSGDGVRPAAAPGEPPCGLRREVVSFARRDGRVHPRIARAWAPRHEEWLIRPVRLERDASLDPSWRFDAARAFGRRAPLVVEIGSGTGEALLASAAVEPGVDHLGVEVYRPGVAKTVLRADRRGLRNVRVLQADAAALLRTGLPDASVAELWVFFPDPWPKLKHHKRRLVTASLLADAGRVLIDGGRLRIATDWQDYAEQMRHLAAAEANFDTPHAGYSPRFQGRTMTRFERKGIAAGRTVQDLLLVRRPRRASDKSAGYEAVSRVSKGLALGHD